MELAAWGEVSSPSPEINKNGLHDHWLGPFNSLSNIYQMPLCQVQLDEEKQKDDEDKISRQFAI